MEQVNHSQAVGPNTKICFYYIVVFLKHVLGDQCMMAMTNTNYCTVFIMQFPI